MSEQAAFRFGWLLASLLVFAVVQAGLSVVIGIGGFLTFGIGWILYLILRPLAYFIGGLVTGAISPGITIREPAVAALVATIGGAFLDAGRQGVIGLIIASVVAYAAALWGAQIGESRHHVD